MDYKKYTQIFNRYMPVIKILLKKSLQAEQSLKMDKGDFEKVGIRKSGYKFRIEFVKGRVNNIISGSDIASELAIAMQENEGVRNTLITNDFVIELNTRFELKIKCTNQTVSVAPVSVKEEPLVLEQKEVAADKNESPASEQQEEPPAAEAL